MDHKALSNRIHYLKNREKLLAGSTRRNRSRFADVTPDQVAELERERAAWWDQRKARTREKRREQTRERNQGRVTENREVLNGLKSVPCKDCGQTYPPYVMDFDHVHGEKRFGISDAIMLNLEDLLVEIEKCDVVCANCHRERTHGSVADRIQSSVAD